MDEVCPVILSLRILVNIVSPGGKGLLMWERGIRGRCVHVTHMNGIFEPSVLSPSYGRGRGMYHGRDMYHGCGGGNVMAHLWLGWYKKEGIGYHRHFGIAPTF
eukprot:5437335-Amphidinium_carterae.1